MGLDDEHRLKPFFEDGFRTGNISIIMGMPSKGGSGFMTFPPEQFPLDAAPERPGTIQFTSYQHTYKIKIDRSSHGGGRELNDVISSDPALVEQVRATIIRQMHASLVDEARYLARYGIILTGFDRPRPCPKHDSPIPPWQDAPRDNLPMPLKPEAPMAVWIIQRPQPGRRFHYAKIDDDSVLWLTHSKNATGFVSLERLQQHIKDNRRNFGPDDRGVEFKAYDGSRCPHCMEETVRHVGTAREWAKVTLELVCTRCNHTWFDVYIFKESLLQSDGQ